MAWGGKPGALDYEVALPSDRGQALDIPRKIGATRQDAFIQALHRRGPWAVEAAASGDSGKDVSLSVRYRNAARAVIESHAADGYLLRTFTIAPEAIVAGGDNGFLNAYGLDGKEIGGFASGASTLYDFIGHHSDVLAVAASPDGRFLVSGSADQTLRLWNLTTRELLLTLLHDVEGEWVMWTPQGFFASSPAGAKLLGWQINRGPEREAMYVPADELRDKLYRPDIVASAIRLGSAGRAARNTNVSLSDWVINRVSATR